MNKPLCILLGIFITLLFLFLIHLWKRKRSIRKTRALPREVKIYNLKAALEPSGFTYDSETDLITSTLHPWQRQFGYEHLYDVGAPLFHMILHCQPIYFDYEGKTWLIELWKGQYGINIGSEIGVYYADELIEPEKRKSTHFSSINDQELLHLSSTLYLIRKPYYKLERWHWWLTGFSLGTFAEPEDIVLDAAVTFPNHAMLNAFLDGVLELDIPLRNISIHYLTVKIRFDHPLSGNLLDKIPIRRRITQWINHFNTHLFCFFTRPFSYTLDRLTYLLIYSPFLFRLLTKRKHFKGRKG